MTNTQHIKNIWSCLKRAYIPFRLCSSHLKILIFAHNNLPESWAKVVMKWFVKHFEGYEAECKTLHSRSRIFMGYEGALSCPGRDSHEFIQLVSRGFAEMDYYFDGRVAPRVSLEMSKDNPEEYPTHYLLWSYRAEVFNFHKYLNRNFYWLITTSMLSSILLFN